MHTTLYRLLPARRALSSAARAGLAVLLLAGLPGCSTAPPAEPADVRQALAPTGTLRVGVYAGSPTSLVRGPGPTEQRGLTVEIGHELGRRLGVPVQLVVFERVPDIVDALKTGRAVLCLTFHVT